MRMDIRLLGISLIALLTCATAAWAEGEIQGTDIVRGKDTHVRTLLIGEQVYHVTPETVIRSEDGISISLAEVAVPDRSEGQLMPLSSAFNGHFRAVQSGDRFILQLLDLEAIPE